MRAFKIDPVNQTVTAVDYDGNGSTIYRICGWDTFDMLRVNDAGDTLAIDDNGLYAESPSWFVFAGVAQPLCGVAMLIGPENEDETQLDCVMTEEEVRASVGWITPAEAVEAMHQHRRDLQSDMAILRARGMNVIDATFDLPTPDDDGNARMG